MSVTYNPDSVMYAIVEYLKSSEHIYDPVDWSLANSIFTSGSVKRFGKGCVSNELKDS